MVNTSDSAITPMIVRLHATQNTPEDWKSIAKKYDNHIYAITTLEDGYHIRGYNLNCSISRGDDLIADITNCIALLERGTSIAYFDFPIFNIEVIDEGIQL